ncbi:MAG: hypothetical protein HeimC2_45430 [Candidatus Heimdallarchaeota archaeon LC_2]|nr:MAG: hypothetical protein HeimC2_45430 [Candidatus Heimdallarchaeota archaeon LC_2]
MYMIYIDESGTTHPSDRTNYILTAVLIHESTWRKFERLVLQAKEDFIQGENKDSIEFHASPIATGKDDFKDYSIEDRHNILIRLSNIIKKNRCRLISVIIDKAKIKSEIRTKPLEEQAEWTQLWAWRLLLERVEKFLNKKNLLPKTNFGLLCVDNNSDKITSDITNIIQQFRKAGTMYLNSKWIIENPFFVDSGMRNLIQLADFVAWVTKQWDDRRNGSENAHDEFNETLFDNIKIRFDRITPEKFMGFGLKIHPK